MLFSMSPRDRRKIMKSFLFASCVVLAVSALQVGTASAQGPTPCGCGSNGAVGMSASIPSPVTVYQRFSYEPTPMNHSQPMAMNPVSSAPMTTTVVESQPMVMRTVPSVQSFRRYSYQPAQSYRSNASNATMERWQYSKADPRKYR